MQPNEKISSSDLDARELSKLGYVQELFRTMGGFSNFAISFSIISILTGAVTLYSHGLVMGGPAEMAFGWPLVSLYHACGRAQHGGTGLVHPDLGRDVSLGVPARWHRLGWFTAWFNIIGQLATLAGIDYGCALFVTPLAG